MPSLFQRCLSIAAVALAFSCTQPPADGAECLSDGDCAGQDADGDRCNGTWACVAGTCEAREPVVCTGAGPCVDVACLPETGQCESTPRADGEACDDGNPCTTDTQCLDESCGGGRSACGDDLGPCERATCDPVTGDCSVSVVADFEDCDDGSACTTGDVCVSGQCKGQKVKCADDGDPCTVASCDEDQGCVTGAAPKGTGCDDGDPCTSGDVCVAGVCSPGGFTCAHLEKPCRDVACDPVTGACSAPLSPDGAACNDGDPCTREDSCVSGACTASVPKCDDAGTPCLDTECDADTGECLYTPQPGVVCSDGNPCTVSDTCGADGQCVGAPKACPQDDEPCTTATCVAGECGQKPLPLGILCNDGDPCTLGEFCTADGCRGDPTCPDDGNPCTAETCDPVTGACSVIPLANGAACDDGNPCTADGTCQQQKCVAGAPLVCPADDDPCTTAVCTKASGCKQVAAPTGATCEDGDLCTAGERCQGGVCVGGVAVGCPDDGNPCTEEACDAATGCTSTPIVDGEVCDDGDPCTLLGVCDGGACLAPPAPCEPTGPCTNAACVAGQGCVQTPKPAGTVCDDGNACTSGTTCFQGVCGGGTAPTCPSPSAPCLVGACDPATGACGEVPAAAGKPCNDGNACTVADQCQGGSCTGQPFDCGPPSDPCTQLTCDAALSACVAVPLADGEACDGHNACTDTGICVGGECTSQPVVVCPPPSDPCQVALCDPATGQCGVAPAGNGASCDPADPCLVSGVCQEGACVGGKPRVCPDDGDSCTTEVCSSDVGCTFTAVANGTACTDNNPCTEGTACTNGVCGGGDTLSCPADGLPCTSDACVPGVGCVYPPEADGTSCHDGDVCTGGDQCAQGICVGDPEITCPPPDDPCLTAVCDPATGACAVMAAQDGAPCDDGSACTTSDRCDGGTCLGDAVPCPADGNPCTVAQCDPATAGCVQVPALAGLACDDGNPCTSNDGCDGAGTCQGAAKPCPAPEGACRVAVCDPATGACEEAPADNGAPCDDGDPCATADFCLQGTCVAGGTPTCPPSGPCVTATCDPQSGACSETPRPDGAGCDDGDACTTGEVCLSATCGGGAALPCSDDGSGCTEAACDPASGECVVSPVADGVACDDQDPCTTGDACSAGACAGTAVSCSPSGDPCVANACQADSGTCALVPLADGAPCDDGDPCSQGDACSGGGCAGTPTECPPSGDDCQANVCQPDLGCVLEDANEGLPCASNVCAVSTVCVAGQCSGGEPLACPGGGPCQQPACTAVSGCTTAPRPDGTVCADGDPCTDPDACASGTCTGEAVDCPEPAPCQVAFCEPGAGCTTAPAPDGAGCSDGNPCTLGDQCQQGACVAGAPRPCGGTPCSPEVCSQATGLCVGTTAPDGTPCDDANPCTQDTACAAGQCAGTPVTCAPPDAPCQVALCSPFAGGCAVFPKPNGATCSDGSACTGDDRCHEGACVGRPLVTCPGPDGCFVYRCSPGSGQCQPTFAEDGELCDDGDACTTGEACSAGLCEGGAPASGCCATAAECDDGTPCTVDACDGGRCVYAAADLPACLGRVAVGGADDGEVSLVDARTLDLLGSVLVPGTLTDLAASADAQALFVATEGGPVRAVDPFLPVENPPGPVSEGRWVAADDGPARLAVVGADGGIETFDAWTGAYLSGGPTVPPTAGAPALDPNTSRLFVPSTLGWLSVVDLAAPLSEPPGTPWPVTGQPARAAFDPVTGRLFLADPAQGGLRVVGAQHGASVAAPAMTGFGAPAALAVDPERRRLYAAYPADAAVRLFDLDTLQQADPPAVAVAPGPVALSVDRLTGRLLVVTDLPTALQVLDGDTLEPVAGSPVPVAAGAAGVAVLWSRPGAVIVNEVRLAPADPDQEWIELHNPGPSAVDVSGWSLSTDFDAVVLGAIPAVPAGGYRVLCRDPGQPGCDGALTLALEAGGPTLTLRRPDGREVDRATIPASAEGTQARRHPGYPGARPYVWAPSAGTPGAANLDVLD